MPPRFGAPSRLRVSSSESVLIVEPVLGIDVSQPSVDAPLGSTPSSDNYMMRDGALELRPTLALRNSTPQPFGVDVITGGFELQSVAAARYQIASGTTTWAVYGQASAPNDWSRLSYVSAGGLSDPPNLASTDYFDFTQTYWATRDDNIAIGAAGSYQSLYCTQSNTTVFSTLTQAPQARFVATYDNFVLAANIKQNTVDLVQRIQWSDRGDPTVWVSAAGNLAGFEDLLAMPGQITRLIGQENRVVVFGENQIWQGLRGNDVFPFSFQPYDQSVGCPYSWTAVNTPRGIVFLSKDYLLYLLPKSGGPAEPIGQRFHRYIRDSIDRPERAWAVYDRQLGQYQLHYAVRGGSGRPQRAVYLDINTGSWAPQSFDLTGGNLSLTRGFEAQVSSSATTWGAMSQSWSQVGSSWGEQGGASEERTILVGSSTGTMYRMNSAGTNDNGSAVRAFWRSTGLMGDDPAHQKTVTEFRVDYQGDSASSLSLRFSRNLGGSFDVQTQLDLPSASGLSQAIGFTQVAARYPQFEVSSEGQRSRLYRFWVRVRRGGR